MIKCLNSVQALILWYDIYDSTKQFITCDLTFSTFSVHTYCIFIHYESEIQWGVYTGACVVST